MCKGSTRTNKDIFDTVSRIDPDAAAFISYNSMRNVLARVKIKIRPPLPTNACDLDNLLQGYALAKNIYKSYEATCGNAAKCRAHPSSCGAL